MGVTEEVLEIVARQAGQAVRDQGGDEPGEIGRDTALFGPSGLLDSIGLVALVLAVEQEISEKLNVAVALADEKALSQRHSPFLTVGSLADYAAQEVEGRRAQR